LAKALGKSIGKLLSVGAGNLLNLALNRPTAQSSTGWNGPSKLAVDGNTNGNYGGGSCTHTN
jgi:hypothetical protein